MWEKVSSVLDGFPDSPASQATRTDSNAFVSAIHDRPDTLQVWGKHPLGLIVGMTDVVSGLMRLAAQITRVGHDSDSFSR